MALRCQREPPRLHGACVDGEPRREGRNSSGRILVAVDIISSLKLAGWHYLLLLCSLEKKNEGETASWSESTLDA